MKILRLNEYLVAAFGCVLPFLFGCVATGQKSAPMSKPVVQLGIEGITQDGWYPLSEIEITK